MINKSKYHTENPKIINKRIQKNFGKLFKSERKKLDIKVKTMAKNLGIDENTIRNWECGKTFIRDLSLLLEIRNKTGIDIIKILDTAIELSSD